MLTGLQKGSVLKSKTDEEGGIFYTILLKRRGLHLDYYKTAILHSPIKVTFNNWDSKNYQKEVNEGYMEVCDEKEIADLEEYIEEFPEKIKRKIYKKLYIELFPATDNKSLYGFEKQKITNISSGLEALTEKFYKKALSVIPILPL